MLSLQTRPMNQPAAARILIADDHDVVRSGLRSILEAHDGWQIVGEAANGKDAVSKAIDTKPNIVVMDYSLPLLNGVEALRQIKSFLPDTEILLFTMHDSDEIIGLALNAGARSYLLKSDAKRFLVSAVESLVNHKPFFVGRLSEKLLDSFLSQGKPSRSQKLSPRERIVVQLVAEGHSNKQISAILNVSVKTVETQRASAMKKLNAKSTSALVRYAIRSKLIEP